MKTSITSTEVGWFLVRKEGDATWKEKKRKYYNNLEQIQRKTKGIQAVCSSNYSEYLELIRRIMPYQGQSRKWEEHYKFPIIA